MPFQNKTLTGGIVELPTLDETEAKRKHLILIEKRWSDDNNAIKELKIEN